MVVIRLAVLLLYIALISANNLRNFTKIRFPDELAENIQEYLVKAPSNECSIALAQYVQGLLSGELWALTMFDAAGKFPSGIISGHAGDMGVFDQCLAIKSTSTATSISGKYCLGQLTSTAGVTKGNFNITAQLLLVGVSERIPDVNSLGLAMAACLPHSCSAVDFQEVYKAIGLNVVYSENKCQTKDSQPELDVLAIFTIAFLGVIASIMVLSTIYDVFVQYTERKPLHPLLIAFSVYTNGKKLLQVNNSPSQLTCLHGLRVISMMWVILGHRYKMHMEDVLLVNKVYMGQWVLHSPFMSGAEVAVDTFFLMSGLVISYSFTGNMSKSPKFNVLLYYFHRYLRLTPAYAVIILINVSLMKHFGSGPQWPALVQVRLEEPCRNYWWTALLYVQNYVNPNELCMGQTWYLAVDTQLFMLSPLLLLPFFKWPKIKPYCLAILIICSGVIPFVISWVNEYRAIIDLVKPKEFIRDIYFPTHARAATWLVGLATGYLLYESKQSKFWAAPANMRLRLGNLILLLASFTVMCACVFGSYAILNDEYNRLAHSIYTGFVPLTWAIAVGYLIFSCVHGYGGPINWILSNPVMQVLSKLSYSMYILHKLVLSLQIFRFRSPAIYGNVEVMTAFWGDFVYTALFAAVWVLAFESPTIAIEKLIFRRKQIPAK